VRYLEGVIAHLQREAQTATTVIDKVRKYKGLSSRKGR
jgi:hypothetical protein